MEKTATLNLRVDPAVKKNAENVLRQLGIPMSTAIDIYLYQIALTGGIPFTISLPKAPVSVNADLMTPSELDKKLEKGYSDMESEHVHDASEAFQAFRENH